MADPDQRTLSCMDRLVNLPGPARERVLAPLKPAERSALLRQWRWVARRDQLAPDRRVPPECPDWHIWLLMAGRGFGKTRAGAEWVTAMAMDHPGCRIGLVASTAHDATAVMLAGDSGLRAIAPAGFEPDWKASKKLVAWPNGSSALLFSAVEPDSLRGPQFHFAWADEIAAWPKPKAAWDNLRLGLRLGERPRVVVTTTPRPIQLLRDLLAMPGVSVTRGSTYDNRSNLPASYLAAVRDGYGHSLLGRQEVLGELVEDQPGALWSRDLLEQCRTSDVPALVRVVVGVDPPAGPGGCGIVAAGLDSNGIAHVLADASVRAVKPADWARAVAAAMARHEGDRVIVEVNNGGDMVAEVLRAAELTLPLKEVRASRGKAARAEPVAALYAAGRVRHAGAFPELEDEMCGLMSGGGYVGPGTSPDRADALVWALTELLLGQKAAVPRLRAIA